VSDQGVFFNNFSETAIFGEFVNNLDPAALNKLDQIFTDIKIVEKSGEKRVNGFKKAVTAHYGSACMNKRTYLYNTPPAHMIDRYAKCSSCMVWGVLNGSGETGMPAKKKTDISSVCYKCRDVHSMYPFATILSTLIRAPVGSTAIVVPHIAQVVDEAQFIIMDLMQWFVQQKLADNVLWSKLLQDSRNIFAPIAENEPGTLVCLKYAQSLTDNQDIEATKKVIQAYNRVFKTAYDPLVLQGLHFQYGWNMTTQSGHPKGNDPAANPSLNIVSIGPKGPIYGK